MSAKTVPENHYHVFVALSYFTAFDSGNESQHWIKAE